MADRFGYGEIGLDINHCRGCDDYDAPNGCKSNGGCGKPITNADRIRAMTDEALAEQLYLLRLDALRLEGYEGFIETKDEVLDWLKEGVDDA